MFGFFLLKHWYTNEYEEALTVVYGLIYGINTKFVSVEFRGEKLVPCQTERRTDIYENI